MLDNIIYKYLNIFCQGEEVDFKLLEDLQPSSTQLFYYIGFSVYDTRAVVLDISKHIEVCLVKPLKFKDRVVTFRKVKLVLDDEQGWWTQYEGGKVPADIS